jgi:uncharacterized membrane protein YeiH
MDAAEALAAEAARVLYWLDFAGVAFFALTGALVAARARQDLMTYVFFAAFTGVGGGTVRDLLIGAPVFWIAHFGYLSLCIAAALSVWAIRQREVPEAAIQWIDAVGLAAYSVFGAAKALNAGVHPVAAATMGVLTACFGGIIRDVLAGRANILLSREIYITASAAGAAAFVGLVGLGLGFWPAAVLGAALAFAVRAGAIARGWRMPV